MVLSSEFEDAAAAPSERLLFQPFQIGTRRLKNRIFMSACGTEFGEDGHPSEQQIRYYERRALGGVGLIHIEFCSIDVSSVMNDRVLRIDEDRFIPGMKILVDRLHSLDVMVVLQLAHAGRQMRAGVAPSAIPCPVIKGTPRALETAEVEHLIEQFAQGARRAKDAGFDGIQVHGAHGYLVHEFVSPLSNQRSDRFGGAWENRRRFPLEVVRRIRALTRSDFLIGYKISAEDNLEGGITLAKTTELAQELEEAGIDYLEVSTGTYASLEHAVQPAMFRRGYLVHYATHMKQELQIPVVAVGRINDPDVAEEILQTGGADIVAFGRGLIADPDLPIKAREGRFDDIRRCVACNQCLASIFRSESMACLINPQLGREMWDDLTPSAESKRVLVIGAGPAGIQATVTASERGHSVILCERSGKLGGKLPIVAAPPGKEEFGNYLRYLTAQLSKSSAEVRLNTEVTPELVAELRPNEVIVASGARATIPPIPGVGGPHVCTADDVLCEDLFGSRIVVLGASGTGCETALFLRQRGHDVTIIARSHKAARSLERFTRNVVLEELKATGVKMIFGLDCTEILADRVVCKDAVGEKAEFPCDGVVLARGYESCNQLAEKLRALGYSVRLIGDAVEPRLILHAVGEAYSAAVSI